MLVIDWDDQTTAAWAQAVAGGGAVLVALVIAAVSSFNRHRQQLAQATARAARVFVSPGMSLNDFRWSVQVSIHGNDPFFDIALEAVESPKVLTDRGELSGEVLPDWIPNPGHGLLLYGVLDATSRQPAHDAKDSSTYHVPGSYRLIATPTISYTDVDGRAWFRTLNGRPKRRSRWSTLRLNRRLATAARDSTEQMRQWRQRDIHMWEARANARQVAAFLWRTGPDREGFPGLDPEKQTRHLRFINGSSQAVTDVEVIWETNDFGMDGNRNINRVRARFKDSLGIDWEHNNASLIILQDRKPIPDPQPNGGFNKWGLVRWQRDQVTAGEEVDILESDAVLCEPDFQ